MTDFFGAFARGNQQGAEIGGRMAARGLQRRTQELDEQLRTDAITMDQYEAGLREQQGRGMSRFHDTTETAGTLRERIIGELDRRDMRGATRNLLDNNANESARLAGEVAARNGDFAQGLTTRRWMNDLSAGQKARQLPGGGLDLSPVHAELTRSNLALGDIAGASRQQTEGFGVMKNMAGRMAQQAYTALRAGDQDGVIANTNAMLELRGIPATLQMGNDGKFQLVPEGEGAQRRVIEDQDELARVLGEFGEGNEDALMTRLSDLGESSKASAARIAELETKAYDASLKLFEQFRLPKDTQNLLTGAMSRMASGGADIKEISEQEDGSLLLNIGGEMVIAQPPQLTNPDDPDSMQTSWQFLRADDLSSPYDAPDEVEDNIDEYAFALREAQQQMGNEQAFNQLETGLAGIWGMYSATTGQDAGNVLGAFSRVNSRYRDADAQPAIDSFMDTFGVLEGTGDNPRSSAIGVGQFIDSTAKRIATNYFADNPVTAQIQEAYKLPEKEREAAMARIKASNPEFMLEMTRALAQENARSLTTRRIAVNPVSLYAAHHFGAERGGDFVRALQNNPNERIGKILTAGQIAANQDDAYITGPDMTVAQVAANWYKRQPELFSDLPADAVAGLAGEQQSAAPPAPEQVQPEPPVEDEAPAAIEQLASAAARGQAYTEAVRQMDAQIAKLEAANTRPLQRRAPITSGGVVPMYSAGDAPRPGLTDEQRATLQELKEIRAQYAELAARESATGRSEANAAQREAESAALTQSAQGILRRFPASTGAP